MELSKTFQQVKAYAHSKNLPLLPFRAKNVSILKEPSTFYELLINGNREARRRVALSALYIGTGSKEKAFVQALRDNLKQNDQLNVNIALDYNRARRIDSRGESSVSVINSLLGHENVTLNLVKTGKSAGIIQGLLSRFDKWNELSSTYHSKLLVFDDNVLLTGANLSSIYFEKRRDRYMYIKDARPLSDYLCGLLERLGSSAGSFDKAVQAQNLDFIKQVGRLPQDQETDSYILPLCQHGPSGMQQCDDFLRFLDSVLPPRTQMHMSSGYFNPKLSVNLSSVIAPSEQANGFYKGSGLLSHVPRIYTALLKRFSDRNPNCSVHLYKKSSWSYHAKGLWIDGLEDLSLHMIGSSNFNWRSSTRDFEVQFVIITKNADLEKALREELNDLRSDTVPLQQEDFRVLNPIYRTVASFIKSLL